MNYFPNGDEEKELIKFLAKYQCMSVNDEKYFFNTKKYYKARVSNLISKQYLRKSKLIIALDTVGIEYAKMCNYEYNRLNKNCKYKERLLRLSSIGAFYHNCDNVVFTPSFSLKDRDIFTTTGRRYIGIFDIDGIKYLTYQISREHDNKYIKSIIYDIQKEIQYRNIIILVKDYSLIDTSEFAFGLNQVLIIQDTDENREKLKYINRINWYNIIQKYYRNKVFLSEYNFCEYTDLKNTYITTFYFYDTEKVNRIKYFLRENKDKKADIICNSEIAERLKMDIPSAKFYITDIEKYIDKEKNVYG